jgi:hypothetical protein
MLRVLVEILTVAGWGLVVILSSNAAAEMAKGRLGQAYPFVCIAGIVFSLLAGCGLIIFLLERVFGVPEIDITAGTILSFINTAMISFNNLVIFTLHLVFSVQVFSSFLFLMLVFGVLTFLDEHFGTNYLQKYESLVAVSFWLAVFVLAGIARWFEFDLTILGGFAVMGLFVAFVVYGFSIQGKPAVAPKDMEPFTPDAGSEAWGPEAFRGVLMFVGGALLFLVIVYLPEPPSQGWIPYYFGNSAIALVFGLVCVFVIGGAPVLLMMIGGALLLVSAKKLVSRNRAARRDAKMAQALCSDKPDGRGR